LWVVNDSCGFEEFDYWETPKSSDISS